MQAQGGGVTSSRAISTNNLTWRKLTPLECERLQTVKDLFTTLGIDEKGNEVKISDSQRYKLLGNGFTIDVIAHLFSFILKDQLTNN